MPHTTDQNQYLHEEDKRMQVYYDANKHKLAAFENKYEFSLWYKHELYFYNCSCHYCNTSILDIRRLFNEGTIGGAAPGRFVRGINLGLGRKNPELTFNPENSVLACYFCNNDKSFFYDYDTYKNVIGPQREAAWNRLLYR
jgi:hypothetical protein